MRVPQKLYPLTPTTQGRTASESYWEFNMSGTGIENR